MQLQLLSDLSIVLVLLLHIGHWMAGFWPGVLWQLHALTGNPIWAEKAQLWQKNLAGKQREFVTQHDWGECACPGVSVAGVGCRFTLVKGSASRLEVQH